MSNNLPKELIDYARVIKSSPVNYGKYRLGLPMHPTHEQVLLALFDKNKKPTKVSFRAGNSCGKSSIVAMVALFYAIEILNCRVVSTAAAYRQIKDQFMSNVRLHKDKFSNWTILESQIKIGEDWCYTGICTDSPSKFQGFHELGFDKENKKELLLIVDEAAGVHQVVYEQISRINPDYLLVMGSPLGAEGIFYKIETDINMYAAYKHFKLTQMEYLKENGYNIDRSDIEGKIREWGISHPLIQSQVFAEFASSIENGLISLTELNKSFEFPPQHIEGTKHIGIDVSASGGDSNVIAFRNGNKVEIMDDWNEPEVMRSCDRIVINLNKLKDQYGITPSQVSLDSDGMGIAFISRLKDLGWSINEFHGGSTPSNTNYSNKISECWMEGIKRIKNCSVILPTNNNLRMQLLSRKQELTEKGKLKLESKADMRSRGVKSPDHADAIFISLSDPISINITAIRQLNVPKRTYSMF